MSVTADEEAQIRKAVEAIDDEEPVGVLKGDVSALTRFWAADLTVNAPTNQVHRHAAAELLELIKQHTGRRSRWTRCPGIRPGRSHLCSCSPCRIPGAVAAPRIRICRRSQRR